MSEVAEPCIRTRSRVRKIAERNGVSDSTVWRLIRSGRLTAHKPTPGITLVDDMEADRVFAGEAA